MTGVFFTTRTTTSSVPWQYNIIICPDNSFLPSSLNSCTDNKRQLNVAKLHQSSPTATPLSFSNFWGDGPSGVLLYLSSVCMRFPPPSVLQPEVPSTPYNVSPKGHGTSYNDVLFKSYAGCEHQPRQPTDFAQRCHLFQALCGLRDNRIWKTHLPPSGKKTWNKEQG